MSTRDILRNLPSGGFLKTGAASPPHLSGEKRAALIRRGNELFNRGSFDLAQRIFITTRYSDGLIRLGDRAMKDGKPLEALRAYWLAPAPDRVAVLVERMAKVMHHWLSEEKTESG